ncbi:PD-(D/E)XK nuclease-like domain-containing protein [Pseudomonas nitroreducens]|uniref:PD-(D/E)XK nuclease-like domain-containing protein n=1 Tax=Pseudomonas nitroreducens TaxID=46680 RepID=UPI0024492739|nr:PD-(D/E)XK nuclease-like domain-containing protein [Pseudomonas nitroreducens]MDG9858458.1 PD-(D/E)XK nuclease-like domain-containing protein [Pseudomonas nitroreducens]
MQPGYYRDLSNEVYHGGEGVSKSQLDLIRKSPALFQWAKSAPEDEEKKAALNMGDAVHAILLEPNRFAEQYAIGPADAPRNTKAGKEKWEEFEAGLSGQTVLTADEGRKIKLIRESVLAHPQARWLIETEGDAEASIYWNERSTGLLARCRPDKTINRLGWLVDVKTTADIEKFSRSAYDYRYHVQDSFYSDGYEAQFGEQPAGFVFLVVSTSIDCGRYPVRLFAMDTEAKMAGRQAYLEDMATYADCMQSGEWSGLETLSLPYWAKEKL